MPKIRRPLSVLCLLVFLGMPLAAQAEPRPLSPFAPLSGLLSSAWERLTAPLASLFAADQGTPGIEVPVVIVPPPPDGDSRGGWDPEG